MGSAGKKFSYSSKRGKELVQGGGKNGEFVKTRRRHEMEGDR